MRLVWSASFDLPTEAYDEVMAIMAAWISSAQREPAFKPPFESGTKEFDSGGRLDVEREPESGTARTWAMRYERPVPGQGLVWTTDVVLQRLEDRLSGAARVFQRSLEMGRPRIDRVLLRPPGFILEMRKRELLGPGRYSVRSVKSADTESLIQEIFDLKRTYLIVAVSVNPFSEHALLDAATLQDELVGIAQVVELAKEASLDLSKRFQGRGVSSGHVKQWGVYGGAVKVYRTRATPADSAFDHPLWLPKDVASAAFTATLKDWCWSLATLQVPANVRDVVTLRAARRSQAPQSTRDGDVEELSELYESCIADEKARAEEQRERADMEGIRADELAEKVRELEQVIEALKYHLEQKREPQSDVDEVGVVPEDISIADAIDRARQSFAATLVLPDDVAVETSLGGAFWYAVFQTLHELCTLEREGRATNKKVLLRDLLHKRLGLSKDSYKAADTDVYATNPETGRREHMRERVHLREGRPAETESLYWRTVGTKQALYKYLIGRLGRHA